MEKTSGEIWDEVRGSILSETARNKRFNELSDETKDLVRKLYMIEKLDYEGDYLTPEGISNAEGAMNILSDLFGEDNLIEEDPGALWDDLSDEKREYVSKLYKSIVEDSFEDGESALVAPKSVVDAFHILFGKKNLC